MNNEEVTTSISQEALSQRLDQHDQAFQALVSHIESLEGQLQKFGEAMLAMLEEHKLLNQVTEQLAESNRRLHAAIPQMNSARSAEPR